MKKVITAILFIITMNSVHSQTYRPLPDSNAYWVTILYIEVSVSSHEYVYKLDSVRNLRTINSKTYTNVFLVNFPWDNIDPVNLNGSLRNDSTGKVFYVLADSIEEHLLYDLSKNIGDTVHDVLCQGYYISLNDVIIEDTSHISIGNKSYKKVDFRYSNETNNIQHTWIEGIGNIEGLINPYPLGMNSSGLVCMSAYDTTWYPYYSLDPCDSLWYSIPKINYQTQIMLSPNPFSNSTRISLDHTYSDITLEVYNLQGQRVAENHYVDCNEITLQRNGLRQGMYFLKLMLDGKMVETRKIIISE